LNPFDVATLIHSDHQKPPIVLLRKGWATGHDPDIIALEPANDSLPVIRIHENAQLSLFTLIA
jgi:hypothetical protein